MPLWGRQWDDCITDRPYPSKVPMSSGTTQNATWPVWYRHHYSEEGPTVTQARVHLGWGSPLQGGDTTPGKAHMGPNTGLAWPTLVLSVRRESCRKEHRQQRKHWARGWREGGVLPAQVQVLLPLWVPLPHPTPGTPLPLGSSCNLLFPG